MEITDKQLTKSVFINSDLESTYKRWTTHDGLLTFFGRGNNIKLTPGGAFEIYFLIDSPIGLRGSEGCKVISFVPDKLFSFTWNAPPHLKQARESNHYSRVTINFKAEDENKTRIDLVHDNWPAGDIWNEVYNYFDKAWDFVLSKLIESFTDKK